MKLTTAVLAATTLSSSAEVALTIYNQSLALVRDTVPINLEGKSTAVTYDRATAQVAPDSVVLRDPTGKTSFTLREQSYRNDPVSQGLLLSLFEGKSIPFQKIYPDGKVEKIPGKIIRSGYNPGGRSSSSPVIETEAGIQFSLPGEPLFPSLGDDSILKPTLGWQIDGTAASFDAQVSYLTGGLSWQAAYNLVAPEEGDTVTLSGWITAKNFSGTGFTEAKLKLVAGDVNVVTPRVAAMRKNDGFADAAFAEAAPAVSEKSFDDFHLYTLANPITLRDQETKQVEFIRSPKVQAKKVYIYDPMAQYRFHGGVSTQPLSGQQFAKDVGIFWTFKNSEENGLGAPLPAGTMRFYRQDQADGGLEFVGENTIDHTPKNEELRVYTGNAFDLIGERKVADYEVNNREKWCKETIEITLKNHSKKEATIVAREPLWRWSNWALDTKDAYEKIDSNTIEFSATLPPDGEKKITYEVTYTWR